MKTFDAYHVWLGIAPKDQPPHHYRLLGIDLFEVDERVIASAADQRMIHLRSFMRAEHVDIAQGLLNKISAARVCLLNPDTKTAYDQMLRQTLQLRPPTPRPVSPVQVQHEKVQARRACRPVLAQSPRPAKPRPVTPVQVMQETGRVHPWQSVPPSSTLAYLLSPREVPVAEPAGDVVWYVRPPSGGQFGPAGSDAMRAWIAEGRVSPDSLVWREGWRDWREASHVFPPSVVTCKQITPPTDGLAKWRVQRAARKQQEQQAFTGCMAATLFVLLGPFALLFFVVSVVL